VAESVLTAIMGREAAYTGQEVTWEEVQAGNQRLVPDRFEFGPMPFPEVARPGQTEVNRGRQSEETASADA